MAEQGLKEAIIAGTKAAQRGAANSLTCWARTEMAGPLIQALLLIVNSVVGFSRFFFWRVFSCRCDAFRSTRRPPLLCSS